MLSVAGWRVAVRARPLPFVRVGVARLAARGRRRFTSRYAHRDTASHALCAGAVAFCRRCTRPTSPV
jgi:hypothetical protein